jgi:pimeloyl-ACP methyl ester carboxylesterase
MDRIGLRHAFGPRRLVALAVIAAVAIGLGYVRLAPGPGRLAAPPGAHAGDLTLKPCTYPTESGDAAAECGTLVVAENPANAASRLIALPVTRIKATSPDPAEPIFYLEGGPGLSNTRFPQASRFARDRDVVLVGYRGVDGSVRLDCPEVDAALTRSTNRLEEKFFRAYGDAFRVCAKRLQDAGVDPTRYGLPQQVDDLEAARVALGYDRVDLLSQSAGTRTAMIYAWRYPERIHRSVMIGVNPPGNFLYDAQTIDEQIGRYADLCAQDARCRVRTDDLAASMGRTNAAMPGRWLFLPIKASNVRIFAYFGLMESSSATAPLSAPETLDAWLSAAEGDASGFWLQSLAGDLLPMPFVWGQYAAGAMGDAQAARDYFSTGGQERNGLAWVGSAFPWGGGRLADDWPAAADVDAYSRVRTSSVETLLIGGALDTATPPQVATKELLPYLPNGHQVVLPGIGHIASFFAEQPAAGSRLINTFFASGRVDDSLYKPQRVHFTPGVTHTMLAKLLLGTVVTVAGLALLSLLWMIVHLIRRGPFSANLSAALRSVWPLVLGLGGLSGGVLIALVVWPSVRVADERLVVLAIVLPVGAGIALAWLDPADRRVRQAAGVVLAVGGALVGAWLGFHATDGPLAALATIAGAAAAANLALIGLDAAAVQAARSRIEAAPPVPAEVPGDAQADAQREGVGALGGSSSSR